METDHHGAASALAALAAAAASSPARTKDRKRAPASVTKKTKKKPRPSARGASSVPTKSAPTALKAPNGHMGAASMSSSSAIASSAGGSRPKRANAGSIERLEMQDWRESRKSSDGTSFGDDDEEETTYDDDEETTSISSESIVSAAPKLKKKNWNGLTEMVIVLGPKNLPKGEHQLRMAAAKALCATIEEQKLPKPPKEAMSLILVMAGIRKIMIRVQGTNLARALVKDEGTFDSN